jgi:hypothetical protein
MSNEYQIHQIQSVAIPMQAVFYDPDEMEITRQDIICLAVIRPYPEAIMVDSGLPAPPLVEKQVVFDDFIRPLIGQRDGDMIDPSWLDGFLGIEYNGFAVNWDEAIRELEAGAKGECEKCKKGMN